MASPDDHLDRRTSAGVDAATAGGPSVNRLATASAADLNRARLAQVAYRSRQKASV